jgi:pyruvate dehydrogenase E2 component (dihydrolipoamide acetyltransferase)
MAQDIQVPDIGDFKDVEVIDVLVKAGDRIEIDTPLITIETEKATMDVPSSAAGVIKSITVKKGDRVAKGAVMLSIEGAAPAAAVPPAAKPATNSEAPPAVQPATSVAPTAPAAAPVTIAAASSVNLPAVNEADFAKAHASPSVRRFARELGVDLSRLRGTGVKARITPDDVKQWVKQALQASAAPSAASSAALPRIVAVDFARFGEVDIKPLGRIQKISGPRLHASWVNVPHVWQQDEADITDLEATRNQLKTKALQRGIKLTPLAFIIKAVVNALREFPTLNSSLDASGQNLVFKKYLHIGFAADTPNGLVVPVIRDADQKDVYELAQDMALLSEKARIGKLGGADMQGGCFTISSLGGIGGTSFTPIINAPEVAILGVAKSSMKPVYNEKTSNFDARLILPFTLAYDHRVIDGAMGVRFTTYLAKQLADVKGLLQAVP